MVGAAAATPGRSSPARSASSDAGAAVSLDEAWQPALEATLGARLAVIIGETDAGKTTLVAGLANALLAHGHTVAIVDADLGQSEIGPPTTVGLGRVSAPVARTADCELVAMHFVGVTTPAAAIAAAIAGARRMVDRARREQFARILVDTSGLVAGELGRGLKQAKIDALDPDLVLALQRRRECEPILLAYQHAVRPVIARLPARGIPRSRSQEDRRRFRARALQDYFAASRPATLDLSRVVLRQPAFFTGTPIDRDELEAAAESIGRSLVWGERRDRDAVVVAAEPLTEAESRRLGRLLAGGPLLSYAVSDLEGMIAGLDSRDRETLGLGVVRRLDPVARAIDLDTPVPADAIAAVAIGRERFTA
jgi:polynucleotide 5'-hydroxyl-kinase GRC3/NOL9